MHVELIADVVVKVFFEVYRELRRWLKLTNDVVDHILATSTADTNNISVVHTLQG